MIEGQSVNGVPRRYPQVVFALRRVMLGGIDGASERRKRVKSNPEGFLNQGAVRAAMPSDGPALNLTPQLRNS